MPKEYVIYCDESEEAGRYFSNFYGGALILSDHIDEVRKSLKQMKVDLRLYGEVKWQKITENYAQKYIDLIDLFFDLVADGTIRVRIMFTQNTVVPKKLTRRHVDEKYFILYYQFIKHGFGLAHSPRIQGGVRLRIYPDKMPDTAEQVEKFRSFLVSLGHSANFRDRGIKIRSEDVAEVASHDHDVLQCLDIVLGAMQFRLNDKHKEIPKGRKRRGKRTVAKHRVYKHINQRIQQMLPNFNIGITTGVHGDVNNRWNHFYRHWLFMPRERIIIPGSKKKKKEAP